MDKPCEMSKPKTGLGERIAAARKRSPSPTQIDFATAMGVRPTQVSRWETETNEPSLEQLKRIAELGTVRYAWLVTGEQPMLEAEVELRGERDEADPAWVASVDSYLASDLGADTPEPVANRLRTVPYKDFWLRPDKLADVHSARMQLEAQWRKLGPVRTEPVAEPTTEAPGDRFRSVLFALADTRRRAGRVIPEDVVERLYAANHSHIEAVGDMERFVAGLLDAELEGPKPGQVASPTGVMKGGVPRKPKDRGRR